MSILAFLKNRTLLLFILIFSDLNANAQLPDGNWHAALTLNDSLELPFVFTSKENKITIINGEENIIVNEVSFNNDSISFRLPIFDSEIRCKLSDKSLSGFFYNYARKNNNIIPFHAEAGLAYRFSDRPEKTHVNITGKYHIIFNGEDEESKDVVGIFKQDENNLSGTFLTTTGDYRFLDGEVSGNRLWLSAFDGSHLFLFTAIIKNDSLINGEFFSGRHWHDTWRGVKDGNAKLPPADSFTFLNSGYDKFIFSFPDENGDSVSISDEQFRNKAVIVQIMGTWCPNCMDETKFLSTWFNQQKNNNIKIIALDFERILDTATVSKNIRRLKKQFDIKYPILFAGSSDKKIAAISLPMLNRVFAFPTTIFLNKDKKVLKIHTGFSGPATGEEYEKYKRWFEKFVDRL